MGEILLRALKMRLRMEQEISDGNQAVDFLSKTSAKTRSPEQARQRPTSIPSVLSPRAQKEINLLNLMD